MPAPSRSAAVLAAGALAATALVMVGSDVPAHARVLKSCSSLTGGLVVLDRDNTDYRLTGECSTLRITAHGSTVDVRYVARLEVLGDRNVVEGTILYDTVVSGVANTVHAGSMRKVKVRGKHNAIEVDGLLERARIRANRSLVVADSVLRVVTKGNRNKVLAGDTTSSKVVGNRNRLAHTSLSELRLKGKRNTVSVAKGTTRVKAKGKHNALPADQP
ncbi:DUF3060 domain-containing protein [Nocardioides alcanivorans]|uniref:DUF3060 domain-containing protein n=1 Tax=Nocardioides alcanivorans TaxID=2897352 RepID=UPI001F1CD1AD|nr:DUF3060 domain-containing protein [Nocardioides alcanivorans]